MSVNWGEPDQFINRADLFEAGQGLTLQDQNFGGGKSLLCASDPRWGYKFVINYCASFQ